MLNNFPRDEEKTGGRENIIQNATENYVDRASNQKEVLKKMPTDMKTFSKSEKSSSDSLHT